MGRLLDTLDHYSLGKENQLDEMLWTQDEERGFSVRSMCEALSPPSQIVFPSECIWNSHVQSKFSFLLWELWWNKIPTINNLIRRGLILLNWCCLCKGDGESIGHTFLHFPWSATFWNHFISKFRVV